MIYNVFPFFNELELLELRLEELSSVVDKFVLVEATRTFTNNPKLLYFEEYKNDFKKFEDKIIHIIVDDLPVYGSTGDRDLYHKNACIRGLTNCAPDDIILISDADEIFRKEAVIEYAPRKEFCVFDLTLYYYWLNCLAPHRWVTCKMVPYQMFLDGQTVWNLRVINAPTMIPNGGWHFSWLGGPERVYLKLHSFAHTEWSHLTFEYVEDCVNKGKYLLDPPFDMKFAPIDDSYPSFVRENLDKFKPFIKTDYYMK